MTRRAVLTRLRASHLTVRIDACDVVTVQGVRLIWHRAGPAVTTACVKVRHPYALHVALTRHGGGWRMPTRIGTYVIYITRQWTSPTSMELYRLLWRRDRALMRARAGALRLVARTAAKAVRTYGEG